MSILFIVYSHRHYVTSLDQLSRGSRFDYSLRRSPNYSSSSTVDIPSCVHTRLPLLTLLSLLLLLLRGKTVRACVSVCVYVRAYICVCVCVFIRVPSSVHSLNKRRQQQSVTSACWILRFFFLFFTFVYCRYLLSSREDNLHLR